MRSTLVVAEPTLRDVVYALGGDKSVEQLQVLFELDEHLEPVGAASFLRYIDLTRSPRVAAGSVEPELPRAFVTLADYARSVLSIRSFIEATETTLQIGRLLKQRKDRPSPSTITHFNCAAVEHELIWDCTEPTEGTNVRTKLKGLLFLALLSGDSLLMRRRLSIAWELRESSGGRLARMQDASIHRHEVQAVALLNDYLSDPQVKSARLRALLAGIVSGEFATVANWGNPVRTYETYRELPAGSDPMRQGFALEDPRYRGGFTVEDLRSPGTARSLYGSSVYLDQDRVQVLDEMIAYFGADRCALARGEFQAAGSLDVDTSAIDDTYVILVVESRREGLLRQDAIAISPFAGAHAVYYVRSDAAGKPWQDVLATGSKMAARAFGARRLPFRDRIERNQYDTMVLKLQALAECDAATFRGPGRLTYDSWSGRYTVVG